MDKCIAILLLFMGWACQSGDKNTDKPYALVITVEDPNKKGSDAAEKKIETDTVRVASPLAAYSKGVQKYASVLMNVSLQAEKNTPRGKADKNAGEVRMEIWDNQGNNIMPTLPQNQKDSIIMHFIHFARKSTIPYYERVKDFELKMMHIR